MKLRRFYYFFLFQLLLLTYVGIAMEIISIPYVPGIEGFLFGVISGAFVGYLVGSQRHVAKP